MSAFEDRLAELLAQEQARIDEVVAEVRAAGLNAIAAFAKLAGQIAAGQVLVPQGDIKPAVAELAKRMDDSIAETVAALTVAEPVPTTPAHMRVPGLSPESQAIFEGMAGRQQFDHDAIAANMRV